MAGKALDTKLSSMIGHWSIRLDGTLFWSDEVYVIHGMEPGCELDMEEAINAYHPDDRARVVHLVDRALKHKESYQFELRLIRKSGETRYVRSTGVVRLDVDGDVESVFGVFQDITESMRQTRELQEKTTMLLQAEHLGGVGHWSIRPEGTLFWSDEVYVIHGMEVGSEIDVKAAIEAYHPDDREKVRHYVERALKFREDYNFDLRIVRKSGEIRNVLSTGVVSIGTDGAVDSVFGVFKDVTKQKRLEARLRQAALDADSGNRAKSEFLGSMSHELRTPLHSILGFSQMLEMNTEGTLTEGQADCVDYILRSGRHLLGLIDNVLDFVKMEVGHIDLSLEVFDLKSLVAESVALLRPKANERNIEIHLEEGESSWPQVIGDIVRARQILLNILSNAIKYNREGGGVSIWVELLETGLVRVCFKDEGEGILEENHNKAFESFMRLGAESEGVEGTGIGLALSRKLANRMNGQIDFASEVGEGCTFWLELPMGDETLKEDDVNSSKAGLVLYVEDNRESVALMRLIISRIPGLKLVTMASGDEALAFVAKKNPDLVILDLNLPGLSGFELLEKLRQMPEGEGVPVFALTGAAASGDIAEGKEAGFDEYFTKPIKVAEVLAVIQDSLA